MNAFDVNPATSTGSGTDDLIELTNFVAGHDGQPVAVPLMPQPDPTAHEYFDIDDNRVVDRFDLSDLVRHLATTAKTPDPPGPKGPPSPDSVSGEGEGPSGPTTPTVWLTTNASYLIESAPAMETFVFSRSPAISSLTVNFTISGTASTSDWESAVLASGQVTFPTDEGTVYVQVAALEDTLLENAETLIVTLVPSTLYDIATGTAETQLHDGEHGIVETGFSVEYEDVEFEDVWHPVAGDIIWWGVDHRWWPELPSGLAGEVRFVEFFRRPYGDLLATWESFAGRTFGPDATEYFVDGHPGEGHWDIMFQVGYRALSWFQAVAAPKAGVRIASVKWQGYDEYMDGESNLDSFGSGMKFFPERNSPTASAGFEVHNKVYVEVSLGSPLPAGIPNADLALKIFDPDFLTNGGVAASDEHLIDSNGLLGDDNLGAADLADSIHFAATEQIKRVVFTTSCAQPGDNFRVVAWPALWNLTSLNLGADGQTIRRGTAPLEANFQTKLLTIWRSLHVELDSLGPPVAERFDGAGVGNDDVAVLNLDAPPIFLLQAEYPKAFVQVKTLSNSYDVTDDAAFDHNSEPTEQFSVGDSVRDVRSEEFFWVVQLFGAYEGSETQDHDDEEPVMLGRAPGNDGPCNVYFEAIRDARAYLVAGLPDETVASEVTVRARVAAHESLHRFGIFHPDPVADEGPGGQFVWEVGAIGDAHNELSPRQIRAIQITLYPQ